MSVSETEKNRLAKPESGPFVKYLVRRETHSSRALVAVFLALLLLVTAAYLAIEAILWMSKEKALLATPTQLWEGIKQIPSGQAKQIVIPIAIGLVLLGAFFTAKAIMPGRLNKHWINDQRAAFVVDNGVIAASVSRKIRETGNLPAGQVTTAVSTRKIEVSVVPTSGQRLDRQQLLEKTRAILEQVPLSPRPKVDLKITKHGQVSK